MDLTVERLRRVARKPPGYLARRVLAEGRREGHRLTLTRAAGGRGPVALENILGGSESHVVDATASVARSLAPWPRAASATLADPGLLAQVRRRAAAGRRREMELFGDGPVFSGVPPRWLEDVRSGYGWPPEYHRQLDYRNAGRPSDVKVAWELSRLRHVVALAQSVAVGPAVATEDLRVIDEDVTSWIRANPIGRTVNWACAMEVALRAVNLICADGILLAAGRPVSDRTQLVRSLYQHGWFLNRNLEISDLNGNHFLADAVGLIWLGRFFEEFGEGEKWWRSGVSMVQEAAHEQVLTDGLDHEGSLPYHALVLEMFLCARLAAGDGLRDIDPVLGRMLDALAGVCGADGRIPDIGDDDGGRVLALGGGEARDARRVLALGGALLDHDSSLTAAGDRAHGEEALWLTGTLPEPATGEPARRPRLFADGGIAVLGGAGDHVVIDVGRVGFRGRGGHGHLDALSYEATLGGALAVRDSGTGSYTGDPDLRNELRDVWAHSVVVVDRRPYATLGGTAQLWAIEGDAPPGIISIEGDHDEQRLVVRQDLPAAAGAARLERTYTWRPGQLGVHDRLEGPPGASVESLLQLPAGTEAASKVLRGPLHDYSLESAPVMTVTVVVCRASERYGSVGTAVRAVARGAIDGNGLLEATWSVRVR